MGVEIGSKLDTIEKPSYILCICSVNSRGSISEEIIKFNSTKISCVYNCEPFVAVKLATPLLAAELMGSTVMLEYLFLNQKAFEKM